MAKYIEWEALLDAIESTDWYHVSMQGNLVHGAISDGNALYKADDIFMVVLEAPAADVVPVVRCKDCDKSKESHLMGEGWRFCMNNSQHHKNDHFCGYGERKDGDG